MKTIIVSTDYSEAANNALEYGIAIAKQHQAKLILFNAFEPPISTSTASLAVPGVYKLMGENKKRLANLSSTIRSKHGIQVGWFSNISYVAEELEIQVNQLQADLVILGMKGDSLDRKLFGSVTTSLIRSATFPLLIIPEGVTFQGVDKILFACDYQYLPKFSQLEVLSDMAKKFKSEVRFLHIDTKEPAFENAVPVSGEERKTLPLEKALAGLTHSYREMKNPHITVGIQKGIQEYQADLLVMIPHHTGFFDFIFNRSITRKMALQTNIPLLTIPFHAAPKKDHKTENMSASV